LFKLKVTINMSLEKATEILRQYYGYENFRPMQAEIIQAVLGQKDAVVLMPTGGGKSICFQVPALVLPGMAVVVSPLIALMKDQVEALRANGIPAAFLNSTQTPYEQSTIENECLQGQVKLLYVSPEKLLSPAFTPFLQRLHLNLFAVDEAHCISAWGHDFRPEYTQLRCLKEQFPQVPVVALTATADRLTQKDIQEQLQLKDPEVFLASFDRPNIRLRVGSGRNRLPQVYDFLERHPHQPGIIYCLSRNSTETVAGKLKAKGYRARHYHAGLSAEQRSEVQEAFLKDDVQVVCATIAFGMGIDKSNVRWVIHYNLPKNLESYYQEIGRAGRDGTSAEALLFYSFADVMSLRSMLTEGDPKQSTLQLAKLERMQHYADATICRRRILLQYFGETYPGNCRRCDICLNPPLTFDGTQIAQKALSAVARTQEQVGLGLLIDILRGSYNQQVLSRRYEAIKTFGAGRDLSYLDWQSYLQQMINDGILEIAYDQNYALKLTPLSRQILFEGRPVELVKFEPAVAVAEPKAERGGSKKEQVRDELFERLRKLRKQLADDQSMPPYVIFSDKTLEEMAAAKPTNRLAMLQVSGVGAAKYEKYGEVFINEILEFVTGQQAEGNKIKGGTHLLTLEAYKEGLSPEQIASRRGLGLTTIQSHLAALYEQGHSIRIREHLNSAEYEQIRRAIGAKGEEASLKELHAYLNGSVDYFKIKLGLAHFTRQKQQKTVK
jgi:ATP-dependent DNA helicase RecQ